MYNKETGALHTEAISCAQEATDQLILDGKFHLVVVVPETKDRLLRQLHLGSHKGSHEKARKLKRLQSGLGVFWID